MKKQRGLVMFEFAYVLPIFLAVVLLLVASVDYALNSFAANDVLTDVHSQIISDVADVSNSADGAASGYAICSSGKVALDTGKSGELTTHVKQALEQKGVTFVSGEPVAATMTSTPIAGFDVYVLNFTGTANSLVLPDMLEKFLPINVDTIVSLKDTCQSP